MSSSVYHTFSSLSSNGLTVLAHRVVRLSLSAHEWVSWGMVFLPRKGFPRNTKYSKITPVSYPKGFHVIYEKKCLVFLQHVLLYERCMQTSSFGVKVTWLTPGWHERTSTLGEDCVARISWYLYILADPPLQSPMPNKQTCHCNGPRKTITYLNRPSCYTACWVIEPDILAQTVGLVLALTWVG